MENIDIDNLLASLVKKTHTLARIGTERKAVATNPQH